MEQCTCTLRLWAATCYNYFPLGRSFVPGPSHTVLCWMLSREGIRNFKAQSSPTICYPSSRTLLLE